MPTPYFRFKQFTVWHDLCAMKVGTDGVILGSLAPVSSAMHRILDIGSGSGLVALMLAQRCPGATITAIDIDESAFRQTELNFQQSLWSNRLNAVHAPFQEFSQQTEQHFDLIVSNPPFFSNSLKNPTPSRTVARHNDTLPLRDIFDHAGCILRETGSIVLILPVADNQKCVKWAESYGFHCNASVVIIPKPGAEPKRILLSFSRATSPSTSSELILETENRGIYSPEFTALVRDFYLKL